MKELEVNINFDEASDAWMKNKIKTTDGEYKYICGAICKNGNKCLRITNNTRCFYHKKKKIN